MKSSDALGVLVPNDFPWEVYDKVAYLHAYIPFGGAFSWRKNPVEQLRSGWSAVGFRYLAMAKWDDDWRRSNRN